MAVTKQYEVGCAALITSIISSRRWYPRDDGPYMQSTIVLYAQL